jgi:hypothetical protein
MKLCISTLEGWRYENLDIDVPEEIRNLETFLKTFGYLAEGNKGKLKKFWSKISDQVRKDRHLENATFILCEP